MSNVDGYIPKRIIKALLENYQALQACDVSLYEVATNSGSKSYDGVTRRQLNLIMLDDAIAGLPPSVWVCATARWVAKRPLGETLRKLGVSKDVYYSRCDLAVDLIYEQVNGRLANYKELAAKILKEEKGLTKPPKIS